MENADIAGMLRQIADILEISDGNPYRVRAYRQAAQVIDTHPEPLVEVARRGELQSLPSIGEKLAATIEEILSTGRCGEQERLASGVPAGVLDLLAVEGIGPKTAAAAWKGLGVTTVDALESCCRDGRMRGLPRMGEQRVKGILEAIARYRQRQGRMPLHRALEYADTLCARLRKVPGVRRVEPAGSVRRRRETVGDLDLLVAAESPEPVLRAFGHMPEVASAQAEGPTKSSVRLKIGLQVDLRVLSPESFGAALHYFTGSKAHNIAVRTRAVHRGLKLSEYGIFDREDRRLGGATEEEVFRAVGLPWIPPELREGSGELEAAEEGRLPKLIEEGDLRGDLHVHTKDSADARSTLAELVEEAKRLGLRYLAVTDHSRSRPLGLDAERLRAQVARIRELNASLKEKDGLRLLTGIEVDILPDGSLDLPEELLAELDWVVASLHSRFRDDPKTLTARLERAVRSGVVDCIGHPTGRIIGARDACELDLGRVLEVAREEGVALEINAQPERLDLPDLACRRARQAGVKLAISSDAHVAGHLRNLRYGVWVARRGWLERGDVVNASERIARSERAQPSACP